MALRDLIPWSRHENRLLTHSDSHLERDDHPLLSLHREVNRLFDDVFRGFGTPAFGGLERFVGPNVELAETNKEVRIVAELPGLDEKDVEISLEDGMLTLSGEKKAEIDDKDRGYSERSYGRFKRRIGLPQGIDRDRATATFRNGVLTIVLPRSEAANENVRRIPIDSRAA